MRKALMALAIAGCLILSVIGGLLPILQGWIFFVLAIYLFATEFETGRTVIRRMRGRWPAVNRWIERARDHRWTPRQFHEFEEMTDPTK